MRVMTVGFEECLQHPAQAVVILDHEHAQMTFTSFAFILTRILRRYFHTREREQR